MKLAGCLHLVLGRAASIIIRNVSILSLFASLFVVLLFCWDGPGWPKTHCVVEGDFELLTFPPLLHECWDYCCALLCTVHVVLEIEPKTHARQVFSKLTYVCSPRISIFSKLPSHGILP